MKFYIGDTWELNAKQKKLTVTRVTEGAVTLHVEEPGKSSVDITAEGNYLAGVIQKAMDAGLVKTASGKGEFLAKSVEHAMKLAGRRAVAAAGLALGGKLNEEAANAVRREAMAAYLSAVSQMCDWMVKIPDEFGPGEAIEAVKVVGERNGFQFGKS